MMTNVNRYYILIYMITIVSCAKLELPAKSAHYYVSTTGSELLMIQDSMWLVLHSGVGTLCDRFILAWRNENSGEVISMDSLSSIYFDNSRTRYNFLSDSLLQLGPLTFLPQSIPQWDSITIETIYNQKSKDTTLMNNDNAYHDMISITLSIPEFKYLDTSLVEDKSIKIYTVYSDGKIVGKKTGATGFFCLGY